MVRPAFWPPEYMTTSRLLWNKSSHEARSPRCGGRRSRFPLASGARRKAPDRVRREGAALTGQHRLPPSSEKVADCVRAVPARASLRRERGRDVRDRPALTKRAMELDRTGAELPGAARRTVLQPRRCRSEGPPQSLACKIRAGQPPRPTRARSPCSRGRWSKPQPDAAARGAAPPRPTPTCERAIHHSSSGLEGAVAESDPNVARDARAALRQRERLRERRFPLLTDLVNQGRPGWPGRSVMLVEGVRPGAGRSRGRKSVWLEARPGRRIGWLPALADFLRGVRRPPGPMRPAPMRGLFNARRRNQSGKRVYAVRGSIGERRRARTI